MLMKNLFFVALAIGFISTAEQDGFIAKEELDNYTVYLMSKSLIQSTGDFKVQCPGGFQKQQILYVPKSLDASSSDFLQFVGSSVQTLVAGDSQNLHYVIINCLLESGASKSQLVLYGNSFQSATQKLPPGCTTPIVPKVVNPELDKCKKGNDLIESLVKSVISNEKVQLFDASDLAPFVEQINQLAAKGTQSTTDISSFKDQIKSTYDDLNNLKAQFVKAKVECIKNKIIQTINVQISVVAACALQSDLNKIISALLQQELLKQLKGVSSEEIGDLIDKLLQDVQTDNAEVLTLDTELKFQDNTNISSKIVDQKIGGELSLSEGTHTYYMVVKSSSAKNRYLFWDAQKKLQSSETCTDSPNYAFKVIVNKDKSFQIVASNGQYFNINSDAEPSKQVVSFVDESIVKNDAKVLANSTLRAWQY